ncbi:MAG: Ig-like domain-containing protein [Lachnospiraceae bacterium]|nr:Ig-like domain-containing protein [Lachnospiraceae bacterium]
MKQRRFSKGIITLVFLLSVSLFTLFANASTAYAAGTPKLNVKTKAIVKGKDYALKVYNLSETQTVTFTVKDEDIASVDETGVVTALSIGTTVVTAVIEDSESAEPVVLECKVTVGPPALFILFSRLEREMVVGQRSLMSWMIAPLNTVELPKFSSSAPEVASVSAGGIVTAKSAGTAYIFAQLDNGHFGACRITVSEALELIDEPEEASVTDVAEASEIEDATEPVEVEEEKSPSTFADFLINLNANFTNGDNTSENTGADTAQ